MNDFEKEIWLKIRDFQIDDPASAFTFTDRLARENNWDLEYAIRVVHEYKRFIFLICICSHPLTPSDQVDQAWHLHLIYTESYWEDFCRKTLNRSIQHGPTRGGNIEKDKFTDWYLKTKDFYSDKFKSPPPEDIWPSSAVRFGQINFARVNLHKNWVIRKPKFRFRWKF